MSHSKLNPKTKIIELMLGAVVSRAIYVAAELKIADFVKDEPMNIETLSERAGADSRSLYRLMRMLTGHQIFKEEEGRYSLTELGECLVSKGPHTLRNFIIKEDEPRWRSIGRLKDSVTKGLPAFDQIYEKSYFEYLATDPKMNYRFEAGMSNLTEEEDELVADVLDMKEVETVVDVGGGRGGFISRILQRHSGLKGILFELPHVVFPENDLMLNGIANRCEIISGSFFESVPKGGDIYTLKRVLHDWDDHSSQTILKKCRQSLDKGGKVMVIEAVVPDEGGSHFIKDVDVYMMALFSGRERTESEFNSLFESSGLKMTKITPTDSTLSIIEGVAI